MVSAYCYMQIVIIMLLTGSSMAYFGYSAKDQNAWPNTYPTCRGESQSPIFINSSQTVHTHMLALEYISYNNLLPTPILLHNTGYTVKFGVGHHESVPYIFGANLVGYYAFDSLVFHWGPEHRVDNMTYIMEMQLIHRSTKYKTMDEALQNRDGLAILAFFFLIDKKNRHLNPLLNLFPKVYEFNSYAYINESFTLDSILPMSRFRQVFCVYQGSMTIPPCQEAVTWFVFPGPVFVSASQVKKFTKFKGFDGTSRIDRNFRFTQPLGNRIVYLRNPNINP